ncbi:MAG: formaldehyde-activating enzyme [Planctomycetota bacterium]|jgi:5,6,7,8-tetrahydromethanopterin hydro-lyase|nr:formaldehyde-activating enzyme [Planctomycetota bacterium]
MSFYVGEALVGEGNEIAHIDLMIGSKDGPVGVAFANALSTQSSGHTNLLAVLAPNVAVKPSTVMITKVTIKGMKQAVQMFGPAQFAVAKAVAESVATGVIPADQAENLVIVCGVFIHPAASDDRKIYDYNYQATLDAIASAMKGLPTAAQMVAQKDTASHPFKGF